MLPIVNQSGDPANDEGNYPLDTEAALEWCIAHEARIEFRRWKHNLQRYVFVTTKGGYSASEPTFIASVEALQRKVREQP
jgi:hypothetical protein